MKRYYDLLKGTSPFKPTDYERIMYGESNRGDGTSLSSVLRDTLFGGCGGSTLEEMIEDIEYSMDIYIRKYHGPAVYKTHLNKMFCQWILNIAKKNGLDYSFSYLSEDAGDFSIELIKALHDRSGVSKEQIEEKYKVTGKTVKNTLRKLDPTVGEGKAGKNIGSIYVAGQKLSVPISYEDRLVDRLEDRPKKKRYVRFFKTPNTLHPIFLQCNVMQAATVLIALANAYYDGGRITAKGVAVDVWGQLSGYGKKRIEKVFFPNNENLKDFIGEIEDEFDDFLSSSYITETEMANRQDLNIREMLQIAEKGEKRLFSMTVVEDGELKEYRNRYIDYGTKIMNSRILIKTNAENEGDIYVDIDSIYDITFD